MTTEELNLGEGAQLVGQDKYANRPLGYVDEPQNPVGEQKPIFTPSPTSVQTPIQSPAIEQKAPSLPSETTAVPTPSVNKTIDIGGEKYTISPLGDIVAGPSTGKYKVGSNINQLTDSAYLKSLAAGKDEDQARLDQAKASQDLIQAENDRRLADTEKQIEGYTNGSIPLTTGEQAQVDALKLSWQQLIQQQGLVNTGASGMANIAGFRGGAAEYDANFQNNVVGNIVSAGINKVADLNIKMAGAVAALTDALKEKNIALVKQKYDIYNQYAQDRADTINKNIETAQKAIADANKLAETAKKDQQDQVEKATTAMQDAIKAGLTDPEGLKKMREAAAKGDLTTILEISAPYLQTSSNPDIAKYLEYKKGMIARGLVPEDFGTYQAKQDKIASQLKSSEAYATEYAKTAGKAAAEKAFGVGDFAGGGLGGSINPEYAGIVDTILGSGKFTKDQANAVRKGIVSGESPLSVVKNQSKAIMEGDMAKNTGNLEIALTQMQSLDSLMKEFYANGGKTGLISGNLEKVANSFGNVKDPKLVDISVKISRALQKYRNAISGTAYSDQEGKDIASIFPGIKKGEVLNNAITQSNIEAMDADINEAYRNTIGAGYDKLKAAEMDKAITDDVAEAKVLEFASSADAKGREEIAKLAETPGWTQKDIYDWLKLQGKIQ